MRALKYCLLLMLSMLALTGFVPQVRSLPGGDILLVYITGPYNTFTTVAAATGAGFTTTVVGYSSIAPIDAGDLAGYELLVLEGPGSALTAGEVTAIQSFVSGGGGLIVMNDSPYSTTTDPLTSGYGVTIWDTGVPTITGDYAFSAHPIFAGVSFIEVVPVTTPPYAEWDGALTVGAPATAVAWLDGTPIIAVSGTCVIVMAENEPFLDGWGIENANNQQLLRNMLLWLNTPIPVIPEVPFGTAMTFLSMLIALVGFAGIKRFKPKLL